MTVKACGPLVYHFITIHLDVHVLLENEDLQLDGTSSKQDVGRFELSLDLNKNGSPLLQEVWYVKDVSVLLRP